MVFVAKRGERCDKKNALTRDDVINAIRQEKNTLQQKYKVLEIGLFGSYARNQQNKRSDIDILVRLEDEATLIELSEAQYYLKNVLGHKVDMTTKNGIKPQMAEIINRDLISI